MQFNALCTLYYNIVIIKGRQPHQKGTQSVGMGVDVYNKTKDRNA